jgi:hypothetical protein
MTAVDELKIKLIFNSIVKEKRNGQVSFTIGLSKLDEIFEQAKEMEKEQMESAYLAGEAKDKQYYNKTFKNTEK